ncbi:MAG: hypothetical protein ACPGU1_19055 [Myxococcota bacterium]
MITSLIVVALLGASDVQSLIDRERWDEAEVQLESLSPEARPRFEGLIAQGRGEVADAAAAFERALVLTPDVPELHLHAAHAYVSLSRFDEGLRHARAAASLRDTTIAQPLLEARALDGLGRHGEAYSVLVSACDVHTDEVRPWLELAVLSHRQGLALEVRRIAKVLLARGPDRDTALALFHLLYEDRDAVPLLEHLVAHYPGDAELRAHLGHVYARHRRWYSAARLFEEATLMGGRYAFEAADQYRMAGRFRDALRMNAMTPISEAQGVQRVAILFEDEQYARVVAMRPTLGDPASRYRVAYAHYAVGDNAGATDRARSLLSTTYKDAASSLLQAMGRDRAESR